MDKSRRREEEGRIKRLRKRELTVSINSVATGAGIANAVEVAKRQATEQRILENCMMMMAHASVSGLENKVLGILRRCALTSIFSGRSKLNLS